jgi:hypothetical protein
MRVRWMFVPLLAGFLYVGLPSCGDDGEDPVDLLPCPEEGLGVKSSGGVLCSELVNEPDVVDPQHPKHDDLLDCQQQLTEWELYDCREPQLSVDQGHWQNIVGLDPSGSPVTLSFIITNGSQGKDDLILSDVRLTGDQKCMIQFNPATDVESTVVEPGESVFIQANLIPDQLGETHGHIRFSTNAQNFPEVVFPVCARVVEEEPVGTDAGASDAGTSGGSLWRCNDDPNPQVHDCHK